MKSLLSSHKITDNDILCFFLYQFSQIQLEVDLSRSFFLKKNSSEMHPVSILNRHRNRYSYRCFPYSLFVIVVLASDVKSIIFLDILMLQKQVQTLPADHSNNSNMGNKIILLSISIWNTSFNKIQPNISSNNSKMSNF